MTDQLIEQSTTIVGEEQTRSSDQELGSHIRGDEELFTSMTSIDDNSFSRFLEEGNPETEVTQSFPNQADIEYITNYLDSLLEKPYRNFVFYNLEELQKAYGTPETEEGLKIRDAALKKYEDIIFPKQIAALEKWLEQEDAYKAGIGLSTLRDYIERMPAGKEKTAYEAASRRLDEKFVDRVIEIIEDQQEKKSSAETSLASYEARIGILFQVRDELPEGPLRDRIEEQISLIDKQVTGDSALMKSYLKGISKDETIYAGAPISSGQIEYYDFDLEFPGVVPLESFLTTIEGVKKQEDGSFVYRSKQGEDFLIDGSLYEGRSKIRLKSLEDPLKLRVLTANDFVKTVKSEGIETLVKTATSDRLTEINRGKDLKTFDLPMDEKTAFIRVYPEKYDTTITASYLDGSLMAHALQNRYGEAVDVKPISFGATSLQETIDTSYQEGTRSFFIDIAAHGLPGEIVGMGKPFDSKDIIALLKKYPDAEFIVTSSACYGGGLMPELEEFAAKDPESVKRLLLFTQVKPDHQNITPLMPDLDSEKGKSFHSAFFIKALFDDKTFGEAILEADEKAKGVISIDSEALYQGKKIGAVSHPSSFSSEIS